MACQSSSESGYRCRLRSILRLTVALLFPAVLGAGCAIRAPEPWVSPFERNKLADPIMSFSRAPVAQGYLHHVYQAREGARGAEGGSGGGCGCN